jgi:hypothetical protein
MVVISFHKQCLYAQAKKPIKKITLLEYRTAPIGAVFLC